MTRFSRSLPALVLSWASLVACSSPPFTGGDANLTPEGGGAGDAGFVNAGSASPVGGSAGRSGAGGIGAAGSSGSAGSSGAAGDGGLAGSVASAGSSSGAPCPALPGEPMVRTGSFCIDANEVTVANYNAFLANPPTASARPECSWNDSYKPACTLAADVVGQVVRCVDWCDAYDYCQSVGKRLCGAIGGGSSPYAEAGDAASNQWFSACSGPAHLTYPYGSTYDAMACNGADAGHTGAVVISDAPGCEGGYPGLTAMSGNAAEWIDSCSGVNGASDHCRLRGGSIMSTSDQLTCASSLATTRNLTSQTIGFRCCAD